MGRGSTRFEIPSILRARAQTNTRAWACLEDPLNIKAMAQAKAEGSSIMSISLGSLKIKRECKA